MAGKIFWCVFMSDKFTVEFAIAQVASCELCTTILIVGSNSKQFYRGLSKAAQACVFTKGTLYFSLGVLPMFECVFWYGWVSRIRTRHYQLMAGREKQGRSWPYWGLRALFGVKIKGWREFCPCQQRDSCGALCYLQAARPNDITNYWQIWSLMRSLCVRCWTAFMFFSQSGVVLILLVICHKMGIDTAMIWLIAANTHASCALLPPTFEHQN